MGIGSSSLRRWASVRSVGEGMRAMRGVQTQFIIYFPWSWLRAVLEGPLSLYIYYTYQLIMELFGTPRIRSNFQRGSNTLPDRLLTCASLEDSLSLVFFILSCCTRVVHTWTLIISFLDLAELVEGSICLPTACLHHFPLAMFSPHPFYQFLFPCLLPSRCARALSFETRLPPRTFQ